MKTLPPEIHHVIHKWPLPRASAGALASGGTGSAGDAADTKDGDDSEAEEAGAGDTTDGDDGDAAEEAGDAVRMSAAPSTRKRLEPPFAVCNKGSNGFGRLCCIRRSTFCSFAIQHDGGQRSR